MNTKEKILDGARRYLVKHGQAGFTVRAVAGEAGVNPGLVHHYFGSKDNLILSLLETESESLMANASKMKAEMGLEGMKKAIINGFFSNLVVGRLFVEAIILSEKSELVKSRLRDIIRSRREYFTELVGVTDPIDKILVQAVIFGLHLIQKIDPDIELETSINQFYSKYIIDGFLKS